MAGGGHHIIPFKVYLNVLIALLILTIITVWVAQFDFGQMNTVIAMAVASVKAVLVASFFMHLKYDSRVNLVILVSGVFFLVVMYVFCWLDIATRIQESSTL